MQPFIIVPFRLENFTGGGYKRLLRTAFAMYDILCNLLTPTLFFLRVHFVNFFFKGIKILRFESDFS